jgi:hypothetical protein
MADTALEQLHTAIQRQWSRVPSKKAKPYVNTFFTAIRSGTKITAKVVGNHGTYTVSIQLDHQGLTSACSCYIGKHGYCHLGASQAKGGGGPALLPLGLDTRRWTGAGKTRQGWSGRLNA